MRTAMGLIILSLLLSGCATTQRSIDKRSNFIKDSPDYQIYQNMGGAKAMAYAIDFSGNKVVDYVFNSSVNQQTVELAKELALKQCKKVRKKSHVKDKCRVYFVDGGKNKKGMGILEDLIKKD